MNASECAVRALFTVPICACTAAGRRASACVAEMPSVFQVACLQSSIWGENLYPWFSGSLFISAFTKFMCIIIWSSSSTSLNPIIVSRIAELKDKIHELQAIVAPIIPEVLKTIPWKIAVTGTISTSRSEFEKMLRNYGIEVQNSLTKDTTYLVAGDGPVGTKHQSAVKFSVAVVDEPKFLELLNQEINK